MKKLLLPLTIILTGLLSFGQCPCEHYAIYYSFKSDVNGGSGICTYEVCDSTITTDDYIKGIKAAFGWKHTKVTIDTVFAISHEEYENGADHPEITWSYRENAHPAYIPIRPVIKTKHP